MNITIWKGMTTALLIAVATLGRAAELRLGAGSKVWLEGDSSLHPFSSTATAVDLSLSVPGEALDKALAAQAPGAMTVRIPVKSLKSKHDGLDKNLRKALKADEHPDIVFTMASYKLADGKLSVPGTLEVAGAKKDVTLEASLALAGERAAVDGEQALLMTDFGVKPPTMMFGAIKTDNRVLVKFHLELEKAADGQKHNN